MGPCYVYILENPAGRFYIGSTENVERRVGNHNSDLGHKSYTHKNGPWRLVWSELHPDRPAAVRRERQIKAMKSSSWIRQNLLSGQAPTPRD